MLKLIIEDDEQHIKVVKLLREEITIGRQEGNTIRLTERNVSRKHAKLFKKEGNVFIEDLGSYNGTKINSQKISSPVQLTENDKIQIGDYSLTLKVETKEANDPFEEMATIPVERMDAEDLNTLPNQATPSENVVSETTESPTKKSNTEQPTQPTQPTQPENSLSTAETLDLIPEFEQAKIAIETTSYAGTIFPLTKKIITIGRSPDNDVVLDHKSVSHNHAKIEYDEGSYTIYDLQSSNGVRINGELYDKMLLRKDDTIDLGPVRIKFVAPGDVYTYSPFVTDDNEEKPNKKIIITIALLVIFGITFLFLKNKLFSSKSSDNEVIVDKSNQKTIDISSQIALLKEYQKHAEWQKGISLVEKNIKNDDISEEDKKNISKFKEIFKNELKYQKIFKNIEDLSNQKLWLQILSKSKLIPSDSYYYKKTEALKIKAKKYLLKDYYKKSRKALKHKNCENINSMLTDLENFQYETKELRKIKKIQQQCINLNKVANTTPLNDSQNIEQHNTQTNQLKKQKLIVSKHKKTYKTNVSTPNTIPKPSPKAKKGLGKIYLTEAKSAWRSGNCSKAVSKAKKAYALTSNSFAIKIVGICGCKNKRRSWARWAISRTSGGTKKRLQKMCLKNGLKIR